MQVNGIKYSYLIFKDLLDPYYQTQVLEPSGVWSLLFIVIIFRFILT